jgi:hypothetical protein
MLAVATFLRSDEATEGIFGKLVSQRATRRLRGKRDLGPRARAARLGFGSALADPGVT